MTELDRKKYLIEKMPQLRTVMQAQWDYLKFLHVSNWLDDNFHNDIEGRYYAVKILLHTIHYSTKDLEILLNYGLYEKILGEIVKTKIIEERRIFAQSSIAASEVEKLKEKTMFVPILDSGKPHESGNLLIGDLVHKLKVSKDQVCFPSELNDEKLKGYKLLVFVDDCLGSGGQLKKFSRSPKIQEIRNKCIKEGIQVFFLLLVAYKDSIEKISNEPDLKEIKLVVCEMLTNKNRVFSPESTIWDKEERESAIAYFKKIQLNKGVSFLGYQKLDFAIILHNRLPNWSLPIFWRDMPGWKVLLRRKSS